MNEHYSLREKQRQEREELILQAAEEVLLEKGYYETSMEEIAHRVGIAKGTLYLHFSKKEDLIFALFEREIKVVLHSIEQIRYSKESSENKLKTILHIMYSGVIGKRTQTLYALQNSHEFKLTLKEKHKKTIEGITEHLRAILEEGKANGTLDTALPTEVMLYTFFNLLSPMIYRRLIIEQKMPAEEVLQYIQRIYLRGITPPDHA
jgi:TetR/AcrR family fatty acid metabolism transcriptional regulator